MKNTTGLKYLSIIAFFLHGCIVDQKEEFNHSMLIRIPFEAITLTWTPKNTVEILGFPYDDNGDGIRNNKDLMQTVQWAEDKRWEPLLKAEVSQAWHRLPDTDLLDMTSIRR